MIDLVKTCLDLSVVWSNSICGSLDVVSKVLIILLLALSLDKEDLRPDRLVILCLGVFLCLVHSVRAMGSILVFGECRKRSVDLLLKAIGIRPNLIQLWDYVGLIVGIEIRSNVDPRLQVGFAYTWRGSIDLGQGGWASEEESDNQIPCCQPVRLLACSTTGRLHLPRGGADLQEQQQERNNGSSRRRRVDLPREKTGQRAKESPL